LWERADCAKLLFEEGEDTRKPGARCRKLFNFFFTNDAVLLPQFGGENAASDARAVERMARLCPNREIVPIFAQSILLGGGNIHCVTQQIPKGAFR
jgi:agmatine deiminase